MWASLPPVSITLAEIHALVGGELHGDGGTRLSALASLGEAGPSALSFVANEKALKGAGALRAGALLVRRHVPEIAIPQIVVGNPLFAFAQVAERYFVRRDPPRGVASDLVKGTEVSIGADASIWHHVTIGDRVTLGARVTLYPGVFIDSDCCIGDDTILYPNVVVRYGCSIGARVVVHSGSVIGGDGFRYFPHEGRQQKMPQLGGVTIEDDVELGANVTIDRAAFGQTVIKRGAKLDNLVQVGHNAVIGEHSVLVAQVGIAGSATIGHHVVIGGQAGVSDHVQVGDHVMIGGQAGVSRSLPPNQMYSGAPALPHLHSLQVGAVFPMLPEMRQTIRTLKRQVASLEEKLAAIKAPASGRKRVQRRPKK